MIRIAVVVEGRTEEEFIKKVIAPDLLGDELYVTPFDLRGRITVEKIGYEMSNHYYHFDHVTSLVDLYEFKDQRGRNKIQLENAIIQKIQGRVGKHFDDRRVTAYIQQYEFEGLLFSSPDSFLTLPDVTEEIRDKIQAIRDGFNTPEDINDTKETSPSHRLKNLMPEYDKVLFGSQIAKNAGLEKIREQCSGFDSWLSKIEGLPP